MFGLLFKHSNQGGDLCAFKTRTELVNKTANENEWMLLPTLSLMFVIKQTMKMNNAFFVKCSSSYVIKSMFTVIMNGIFANYLQIMF